jgi:alanyl-tRNA synthetase
MTDRLYYHDSYLRTFDATVIASDGNRVYLDRTAFYPTSGGQPFDRGTLAGVAVEDVIDEGERIAHVVSAAVPPGPIQAAIDWTRRFDHMQQHTGQHLLSAVFHDLFDMTTVAVHFGDESATIELAAPAVTPQQLARAEERANQVVFENRAVAVRFVTAAEDLGLRKASDREGELRIVEIADLDRSACGGTHVRSTAEIGPVLIRKTEKIRGNTRVEFVCGLRAIRRARADYDAISGVARAFSASIDEVPALVKTNIERVQEIDKARKKLAMELAQMQGRELYQATPAGDDGIRRVTVREAITDDLRTRAQSFTTQPKAVFVAICGDPPSLLVAASKDSGINAGEVVKNAVTASGGRGGGSATLAQGSVPDREALQRAVAGLG